MGLKHDVSKTKKTLALCKDIEKFDFQIHVMEHDFGANHFIMTPMEQLISIIRMYCDPKFCNHFPFQLFKEITLKN
jgi:hypothetical protein